MSNETRLEPLAPERARHLFDLLRRSSTDDRTVLALDDAGRLTGVVDADDQHEPHLLGDLDVHA